MTTIPPSLYDIIGMHLNIKRKLEAINMQINKHGSFYIRNGWPTKIIGAITTDEHIYSPNNELKAVDTIGVGRVMIKAMRYWATVLGIAEESKDQFGIVHKLTDIGEIIMQNDLYCTDNSTLWLLHRNLAINKEEATAWNWAFNEFNEQQFDKNSFVEAFYSYIQREGASYAHKAIEKEFDCFKNTYVSDQAFSLNKIIEEDTIPFFAPLKLIEYKGHGIFEKRRIPSKEIPEDIFAICIFLDNAEHLKTNTQISIDKLLEEKGQIGKYMNLNYSTMLELLQKIENEKYIKLINNFGNRYIEVLDNNVQELLANHYL